MIEVDIKQMLANSAIARALNFEKDDNDFSIIDYKGSKLYVSISDGELAFDINPVIRTGDNAPSLYVFVLQPHDNNTVSNDIKSWNFWVLSTSNVNKTYGDQANVILDLIKPIAIQTNYDGIKKAVDLVLSI